MALQECGLNLNRGLKELQPHGTLDFPCAGYSSHYSDKQEDIIPWHWHEEIEIIYIEDGQLNLKIPSKSFYLKQGDCIAINSNILHYASAIDDCQLHSLVFSSKLITGNEASNETSVFAKKYIQPLICCNSFSGYFIKSNDNEQVTHWFNCAFNALAQDVFGFEFIIREKLSYICLFLYKQFEKEIDTKDFTLNQNNLRIKKMLEYIHKNFSNNISLMEIAKTVNISERECLRCFNKTIQLSPIQYLLKYRVMQGAEMLLKKPTSTISEVAIFCGFNSPSNFTKIFKRFYKCTPRKYRSLNIK